MNATGWEYLIEGKLVQASVAVYQSVLGVWFLSGLIMLFIIMLSIKTRDPVAVTITSLIFLSLYVGLVHPRVVGIILLISVVMIAGILYTIMFKK